MDYRREIDGLRALAVLPVILFHAGFQGFSGGFVGVDVFFVISGYLITSIILEEKQTGTFTLMGFYERRARRILPALFAVTFVCLPLAWVWLLPSDMEMFSQSLVAVSLFASNVLFYLTSGYFDTAAELKPFLHTWSLGVEEQYYFLYPIFLLASWQLGKKWIVGLLALIAVVSLAAAQWGSLTHPAFTFFLLPTRGWEILIGAIVAFFLFRNENAKIANGESGFVNQSASGIGLFLYVFAVYAFDERTRHPSLYTLMPTMGAALIILFATPQTVVGKLLGSKLLVGVGLISYSAYLWHYPIFVYARHRSIDQPGNLLLTVLAVVSLLIAYLSWKYIEMPFRDRQFGTRKQIFSIGAGCSCVFAAIGLVVYVNGGFPSRVSEQVSKAFSAKFEQRGCLTDAESHINVSEDCVSGEKGNVRGALLGDSIAGALHFELARSLKGSAIGFANMSLVGCPPIFDVYRVDMSSNYRCAEHNADVFDYVMAKTNYEVVILAGLWTAYFEGTGYDNGEGGIEKSGRALLDVVAHDVKLRNSDSRRKLLLRKKYVDSLLSYVRTGKTIVLVYPIPEPGWDVPRYSARLKMFGGDVTGGEDLTTSYERYKARNRETISILDSVGEYPNLIRVKPDKIFCNTYMKARCVLQLNGVSLYSDRIHLSNAGARLVVDEIMKHIK